MIISFHSDDFTMNIKNKLLVNIFHCRIIFYNMLSRRYKYHLMNPRLNIPKVSNCTCHDFVIVTPLPTPRERKKELLRLY